MTKCHHWDKTEIFQTCSEAYHIFQTSKELQKIWNKYILGRKWDKNQDNFDESPKYLTIRLPMDYKVKTTLSIRPKNITKKKKKKITTTLWCQMFPE